MPEEILEKCPKALEGHNDDSVLWLLFHKHLFVYPLVYIRLCINTSNTKYDKAFLVDEENMKDCRTTKFAN